MFSNCEPQRSFKAEALQHSLQSYIRSPPSPLADWEPELQFADNVLLLAAGGVGGPSSRPGLVELPCSGSRPSQGGQCCCCLQYHLVPQVVCWWCPSSCTSVLSAPTLPNRRASLSGTSAHTRGSGPTPVRPAARGSPDRSICGATRSA